MACARLSRRSRGGSPALGPSPPAARSARRFGASEPSLGGDRRRESAGEWGQAYPSSPVIGFSACIHFLMSGVSASKSKKATKLAIAMRPKTSP